MTQQSKSLVGGPNSRKYSGGWGVYVYVEVNMLWGGYSWHIFAKLGISPPHNTLQSTEYYLPVGEYIIEGDATIKIELGLTQSVKIEPW